MKCPNCGAEVQEGSLACSGCGSVLPITNDADMGSFSSPVAPKKSHTGLIVGIACGVVAIIVAIVLCVVLLGGGKNGTYVCKDMKEMGIECTLKVDGSKFTLKMSAFGETEKESGTIKFNGKKVKLTVDGESIEGTYNKSKKTITFEGMTFTKK